MTRGKILVGLFLVAASCLIAIIIGRHNVSGMLNAAASPGSDAPSSQIDFIAQHVQLPESWRDPKITPEMLLERLIEGLDPRHVQWLEVRLWQHQLMNDPATWSEGRLWLAPGYRGRIEWHTRGHEPCSMITRSDGAIWERGVHHGSVVSKNHWPLLPRDPKSTAPPESEETKAKMIQSVFARQGLAGPLTNLLDLQKRSTGWVRETGIWEGRPTIRLGGSLPGHPDSEWAQDRADRCQLYLDGATLWPLRMEWLHGQGRLLLALEYRDPIVNQPMPEDECDRLFSIK